MSSGKRGGRGDKRGGRGISEEVRMSKALGYLLRHGAHDAGLKIDKAGYANVADIFAMPKLRNMGLDLEKLFRLVAESDKQRYALAVRDEATGELVPIPSPVGKTEASAEASDPTPVPTPSPTDLERERNKLQKADPAEFYIRANQGHSILISSEALNLTPITTDNIPEVCIHGTFYPFLYPILNSGGLKTMGRNHIHMAAGLPASGSVLSGMRKDAQLVFYINVRKALEKGVPMWLSKNGVILSEGLDGVLSMEFVEKVVDVGRCQLGTVWEQGKGIVNDLPEKIKNLQIPRGKETAAKHMRNDNAGGGRGGRRGGRQGNRAGGKTAGEAEASVDA